MVCFSPKPISRRFPSSFRKGTARLEAEKKRHVNTMN
jgi:hypothetical protein